MRKIVMPRWSGAGAVSAGSESGGAVGGLCFRDVRADVGRANNTLAIERGVGVYKRPAGRPRAGRRGVWRLRLGVDVKCVVRGAWELARGRLGVRTFGVGGFGFGGLGVDVECVSNRHRGLLRAMALHVAMS